MAEDKVKHSLKWKLKGLEDLKPKPEVIPYLTNDLK
jgi:hypothetical protein